MISDRLGEAYGAARGIRTPDPIITNDVLYQLSYCGVCVERRGFLLSARAAFFKRPDRIFGWMRFSFPQGYPRRLAFPDASPGSCASAC